MEPCGAAAPDGHVPALGPAAAEPEHSGAVDPPEVERDMWTFDLRRGAESARAPSSGAQLLFGFISVLMVWICSSEESKMQRDTVPSALRCPKEGGGCKRGPLDTPTHILNQKWITIDSVLNFQVLSVNLEELVPFGLDPSVPPSRYHKRPHATFSKDTGSGPKRRSVGGITRKSPDHREAGSGRKEEGSWFLSPGRRSPPPPRC